MSTFNKFKHEWKLILKNPGRIFGIFNPAKISAYVRWWFQYVPPEWNVDETTGFRKREYRQYDEYLSHQKSKLATLNLNEYDVKYREALRERARASIERPAMTVLCLAARLGTEVKSFLDLGCFAVGIDLNPGSENHFVVHGDFHKIQYPEKSVDIVFTNALDHVLDFEKVVDEIKRIIKPGGLFLIEVPNGLKEGQRPAFYESFYWSKVDDLVKKFSEKNFYLLSKEPFTYPWNGQHLRFRLNH